MNERIPREYDFTEKQIKTKIDEMIKSGELVRKCTHSRLVKLTNDTLISK